MSDDGQSDSPAKITAASGLMREQIVAQVTTEWHMRRRWMAKQRGSDKIELPDIELTESRRGAIYSRALVILDDIARHDPDPRHRVRAAKEILHAALQEAKLKAELESRRPFAVDAPVEAQQQPSPQGGDNVPREERIRLLQAYDKANGR